MKAGKMDGEVVSEAEQLRQNVRLQYVGLREERAQEAEGKLQEVGLSQFSS